MGSNKISNKFERKHLHFGSCYLRNHFSSLLDSKKAFREIGLKRGNNCLDAFYTCLTQIRNIEVIVWTL